MQRRGPTVPTWAPKVTGSSFTAGEPSRTVATSMGRQREFILRFILSSLVVLGIAGSAAVTVVGCGDDPPEDPVGLPPRNKADASTEPDAGRVYDCSNHESVDDRPACDQCARAQCCEQIVGCDESDDCKLLMDCIGDCAEGDLFCPAVCSEAHPEGKAVLGKVSSCAMSKCKSECPPPELDAGDPF